MYVAEKFCGKEIHLSAQEMKNEAITETKWDF